MLNIASLQRKSLKILSYSQLLDKEEMGLGSFHSSLPVALGTHCFWVPFIYPKHV